MLDISAKPNFDADKTIIFCTKMDLIQLKTRAIYKKLILMNRDMQKTHQFRGNILFLMKSGAF